MCYVDNNTITLKSYYSPNLHIVIPSEYIQIISAGIYAMEAYSHEVSSCGFCPGGESVNEPVFYAYSYPEPQGFNKYPIQPKEAFYHTEMREFLLPYNVVRTANSPYEVFLAFLQSTYMKLQRLVPNGIEMYWSVSKYW
jgi:Family of unknown function (DUF5996)